MGSFGKDVYGAGGGPGVAAGSAGTLPQLQPGLRITAAEFAVGLGIKMDFVAFMRQSLGGDEGSVGKPGREFAMDGIDSCFGCVPGAFRKMSHLACQEGYCGGPQFLSKTTD